MNRSKKIFAGFAIGFAIMIVWIVVDISRKTTFPGSKKPKKEAPADTTKNRSSPKSATHQP